MIAYSAVPAADAVGDTSAKVDAGVLLSFVAAARLLW